MNRENAKDYRQRLFPDGEWALHRTDPEFMARWDAFAFGQVAEQVKLDGRQRGLVVLSALLGCQGLDLFRVMLPAALNDGLTPEEAREVVYQAAAYLGLGRAYPFLNAMDEVFTARGIQLPLAETAATTAETRRPAGTAAQVEIFGQGMENFWNSGPEETRHINCWLAANCFGDYYTRKGLDLKDRELATFCCIAAQGGCEPQLTSHAAGNFRMGNDKSVLIDAVSLMVPYIGYPRCLNALRCVNDAAGK